jgi:hypothetical protein
MPELFIMKGRGRAVVFEWSDFPRVEYALGEPVVLTVV